MVGYGDIIIVSIKELYVFSSLYMHLLHVPKPIHSFTVYMQN